jgi:S-(hydroxymethyl)glutathione dehydrogenase/alcohol dehydrogenase
MSAVASEGDRAVRAIVLERPGDPISTEELVLAPPGADEVLVRLLASGVCHSDLHLADAEWTAEAPVVLGHEGCGVVEAAGPGAGQALVGRTVVLDWFTACMACSACLHGRQWTCTGTRALENLLPDGTSRLRRGGGQEVLPYLGVGTFAERSVVHARTAVPVPGQVDPAVAALIGCCVSTGVGSVLMTARVPAGSSVVVYGVGGVGLSVVMGAALAGATTIVAVDRHQAKLDLAKSVGATHGVTASIDPDATVEEVRAAIGGGADFAFEAIGLAVTIEQTIRSVRTGGAAVLVGMTPFGVRASFDAFDLVDRSISILGSNYGFTVGPLDFPRYADLYLSGRLPIDRLVDRRIELDEVSDAFDAMRRGVGARAVVVYDRQDRAGAASP